MLKERVVKGNKPQKFLRAPFIKPHSGLFVSPGSGEGTSSPLPERTRPRLGPLRVTRRGWDARPLAVIYEDNLIIDFTIGFPTVPRSVETAKERSRRCRTGTGTILLGRSAEACRSLEVKVAVVAWRKPV